MAQLAMAIDLNKCLGCQTCTAACKTQWTNRQGREYMYWNNVETHPGRGFPRDWMEYRAGWGREGALRLGAWPKIPAHGLPWEFRLAAVNGEKRPVFTPTAEPSWGPNWDEDQGAGAYPNAYFFYLPRICNHCSKPACLAACPRGAIKKRPEDGIVLVDQEICRGIKNCIRACPYKKVYFNPFVGDAAAGLVGKTEKCLFCFPRVEEGLAPACARQCVGRVRFVSYLHDKSGPVYQLARKWRVALPLRPDFGTHPNVFYVPPLSPPSFGPNGEVTGKRRIPLSYLEKLFGPRVGEALDTLESEMRKKAKTGRLELMDILIAYRHAEMFRV